MAEDETLLRLDLHAGFFEELDKTPVPWRGRGTFRFQTNDYALIGERVFSREETEAFAAASDEAPQEIPIEGRRARWWAYEGNWYRTRAQLRPSDVAAWVGDYYRDQLAEWGASPSAAPLTTRPNGDRPETYLSACAIFLNEAPYLAEWLEFHLLAGVERFFLYDHESTDSSRDVLAPYVEDGTVVVHDWPVYPGQVEAFEDCAQRHRADSRWIAFIDIDEFLFSPARRPLLEVLRAFEPWPGVLVNRPTYGSSGHDHKPTGLTIESYLLRSGFTRRNRVAKSIAQPEYLDRCLGGHYWTYTDGHAVDEKKRPAPSARGLSTTFSVLRLNHYFTRSRSEYERKLATPKADSGTLREGITFASIDRGMNDVTDPTASAYAPAVKDALRRRAQGLTRSR
jgi:glycosyl transferase family 92